ncbi:RDD family protein [Cellulomonas fengjieae]|uniref:RDD family protein n=1 Tax=Cellulomonas fengjieae TaxID=2819978 RepID=UPI001AAF6B68|nr:RDD family protein [Cellulomonas fengjieae]MBO3103655.1 RDD family protein [Cellulomonas fengjieae]
MADRRDLSSWLGGGTGEPDGAGAAAAARGRRLGLPADGPGSPAPLGRRLVALVIDWVACLLISAAFFATAPDAFLLSRGNPTATLAIFVVENIVLVGSLGYTLGHRLLGLRVRRVFPGQSRVDAGWATRAPGFLSALTRTLLLCLVVPAVVWDSDGRGLHDRVAGTAIVRR